jgi:hypothetical protein
MEVPLITREVLPETYFLLVITVELSGRKLAQSARAARARDFVNFREKKSCNARTRRARAGLTVYPPWIQIRDVATYRSRRDHRKSKFGLRHDIKLN